MKVLYKEPKQKYKEIIINEETAKDDDLRLSYLQSLVCGYIEIIPLTPDLLMICNEEGKLMNLETNLIFDYDYIVGPVVIVAEDHKSKDGKIKGLNKEQMKQAKEILKDRGV